MKQNKPKPKLPRSRFQLKASRVHGDRRDKRDRQRGQAQRRAVREQEN